MLKNTGNGQEKYLTAVVIAMAFLFNAICLVANLVFPSFSGFGDVFVIVLLLLGLAMCFSTMQINPNIFLLCVTILLFVLVSYFYYGQASEVFSLLQNYTVWGIGISVVLMQPYNQREALNVAAIISAFIIVIDLLLNKDMHYESIVWTYSIFPCLATMVVHFTYVRFKKPMMKALYIPGLIMLFKFILNSNRGGLISLIFLLYLILIKKSNSKNEYTKKRTVLSIFLLLCILLLSLNFETIIDVLYNLMKKIGIKISAIDKMYRLIMEDNVMNNRDELYRYAWNGFLKSPLWGNGVGGFSVNHGGWTHNFFLQLLYEGGIILFSLIIIPLVKISKHMIGRDVAKEDYSLFVLLFCTSVPRLLFSTEVWNTQSFWMLLVFGLLVVSNYKKNEKGAVL